MAYYYSPLRNEYKIAAKGDCPFCAKDNIFSQSVKDKTGKIVENEHYVWMVNWYPRFEGHTMVVPKRHLLKLEDERPEEVLARNELIVKASNVLQKLYPGAGIEVFLQTGPGSVSSVPHLHWHVAPSQPSDSVRGVEKMGLFDTKNKGEEKIIMYPIPIQYAREELQKALAEFV